MALQPMSFLLLMLISTGLLLTKSSANTNSVLSSNSDGVLGTLNQLLNGPFQTFPIMVYFDEYLTNILKSKILGEMRYSSVIISSLNQYNVEDWLSQQTPEYLRSSKIIHILFIDDNFDTLIFEQMNIDWNPTYLLILNLGKKDVISMLDNQSLSGIKKLTLIQLSNRNKPQLVTNYPFSKGVNKIHLGEWDTEEFQTIDDVFPDRFSSFEGFQFDIATWLDDRPYIYSVNDTSITLREDGGEGAAVEMLDALGKAYNFTYTLTKEPDDEMWGSFDNGSWNGMLGMVHRKEKHFTVNYFTLTNERRSSFDATVPYNNEGFGISLMPPPPIPKWRSTYYPFTYDVWAAILFTFVLASIFYVVLNQTGSTRFIRSKWDVWIFILRSLFNNSWAKLPTENPEKVFVGFWFLFCMITIYAYTANLVAFLTVPVYPKKIQTVREMAQSEYRVTMYDYGEFVPYALVSSSDSYYRTLGERLDLFLNYDDCINPMKEGTHGFIESAFYNMMLVKVDYDAKESYILKEQLYPGYLSWHFQKNTAYIDRFDIGIQRLLEAGLVGYWIKMKLEHFLGQDWERKVILKEKEGKETVLSMEHLQGVFLILVIMSGVAMIVFLGELAMGRLGKKQRKAGE